jgi:bacterioferritin B
MPAERFVEQLNVQIGHEFAAHQQYVACAVYYDALTMPRMARFSYIQALEERDHAMMRNTFSERRGGSQSTQTAPAIAGG